MWTAITGAVALYFNKYKSQFIIGGLAIAAVLAIGVFAIIDIKRRENLAAELAVQKFQIEQLKLQAEAVQKDQQKIIKNSQQMIENLTQIRTEIAKQQKLITKYDLDKIGAKHPKLLENHINKATKDTFNRLEELTKP